MRVKEDRVKEEVEEMEENEVISMRRESVGETLVSRVVESETDEEGEGGRKGGMEVLLGKRSHRHRAAGGR